MVRARTSGQTGRCSLSGVLVSSRKSFRASTIFGKLCKQTTVFLSSANSTICIVTTFVVPELTLVVR